MRHYIAALLSLTVLIAAPEAWAKKNKHWHDHGRSDRVLMDLDAGEVAVVRTRIQPYYVRHCPPGLAKKHNGCRPPGHTHRYVIGQPYYGPYWEVPHDVIVTLPYPPRGSRYIWVDRDILLVSEATKKVLDAVVILSGL